MILIFSIHLLYKNKNKERKNYLLFLDRPCFCFELYHLFSIDNCYCTTRSNRKNTGRPRYNCSKIKRTWRATRHGRGRGSSPAKRREGTFRSKANRSAPWSNVTRILRVVALTSKLADSRYRRYDYGSSSALLSKSLPLEKRNNKRKKPKSSPSPLPFIKKKTKKKSGGISIRTNSLLSILSTFPNPLECDSNFPKLMPLHIPVLLLLLLNRHRFPRIFKECQIRGCSVGNRPPLPSHRLMTFQRAIVRNERLSVPSGSSVDSARHFSVAYSGQPLFVAVLSGPFANQQSISGGG